MTAGHTPHSLCILWALREQLHEAAEKGHGGVLRYPQVVSAERESRDDAGDALCPQDFSVALVLGQVAQGRGGCSHNGVVTVVEQVSQKVEPVGCADDVADIDRPLCGGRGEEDTP